MPVKLGSIACLAALLALSGCAPSSDAGEAGRAKPAANTVAPAAAAADPAPPANVAATAAPGRDDPGSQFEMADLAGRWRVVGVAPGKGVSAFVPDDPAYMGRTLEISAQQLSWTHPDAARATLGDRCREPVTQHLTGQARTHYEGEYEEQLARLGRVRGDPHGIECDEGNWGPEAAGGATLWRTGDALLMSWYDGIVLKLTRNGP